MMKKKLVHGHHSKERHKKHHRFRIVYTVVLISLAFYLLSIALLMGRFEGLTVMKVSILIAIASASLTFHLIGQV
jgi:hypothetical protein